MYKFILAFLFGLLAFSGAAIAVTPSSVRYGPLDIPPGIDQASWRQIVNQIRQTPFLIEAQSGQPGRYRAENATQALTATFAPQGTTLEPKQGDWRLGLQVQGYGYGSHLQSVSTKVATLQSEGNRIDLKWDDNLQETFRNAQNGIEQLFTLTQRPAGHDGRSPLRIDMKVAGGLKARIKSDTDAEFTTADGKGVLTYQHLQVFDADGRSIPARLASTSNDRLAIVVQDQTARYPLTIDPLLQMIAYLKASNTGAGDSFGWSVAISGNTMVVSAPGESSNATGVNGDQSNNSALSSGAAYVFVRNGTTWSQQAYLKASNTGEDDFFGKSVAISGDTVVVGADQEDSSATGVNGDQSNDSAEDSGAAYVFVRNGTTWSQQAYLKASNTDAGDYFGASVAISGDTMVVSAPSESSNATGVNGDQNNSSAVDSGAAYVFVRSGTTWSQQAYLKASNTDAGDSFGWSVAISGDTMVVSAPDESSNATGVNGNQSNNSAVGSGAAYVFVRSGTTWSQQAYLKAPNPHSFDEFGVSVAISGDTVVVGADREDSILTPDRNIGAAYVFVRSGTTWSRQKYLYPYLFGADDLFGISVAISGDTVVVGAEGEASKATGVNGDIWNNSALFSGAAYVYERSGTTWSQQAYLKASNTNPGDSFGHAVAISGDTVVIGAEGEESNATGVNGDQKNNLVEFSGAVYVFVNPLYRPISLDGFLNYSIKNSDNSTPFAPIAVTLNDGLIEGEFTVKKPVQLGVPASVDGESILNADVGLEQFSLLNGPKLKPARRFIAISDLGMVNVTAAKGQYLLMPSASGPGAPAPDPNSHSVDNFLCYDVTRTPRSPAFPKDLTVSLNDDITQPAKQFAIVKPVQICFPATVNAEPIKEPDFALMCYATKPAKGEPRHIPVKGIFVNNALGSGTFDTVTEKSLCLPATVYSQP